MNKTEMLIAASMLEMEAKSLFVVSFNDYEFPLDAQHVDFARAIVKWGNSPDNTEPRIDWETRKIYIRDWLVAAYCAAILRSSAGVEK